MKNPPPIIKKCAQIIQTPLFHWSILSHLLLAATLRLILILYSIIHDQIFVLQYTDIDYHVFTGGARYLLDGRSPFLRYGYRYTPLFALLTLPNIILFECFGKILFSMFDVATGYLIYKTLRQFEINIRDRPARLAACLWLYNPLPLIVSTRGSSDSVVTFLVLWTLWALVQKKYNLAGVVYGLVVHCKLYPIIYAPAFYLFLSGNKTNSIWQIQSILPLRKKKFLFIVSSLTTFIFTTWICFYKFGDLYIQEAWLYHFKRQDLEHNFSPYFYLYALWQEPLYQKTLGFFAFIPQLLFIIHFSIKHTVGANHLKQYRLQNLFFALFIITFLFVSLNKVCTSQYFLWYLCLLPLASPYINVEFGEAARMLNAWLIGQGFWLFFAYCYEFLKFNVLFLVWSSSCLFLCINLQIAATICARFQPLHKVKSR